MAYETIAKSAANGSTISGYGTNIIAQEFIIVRRGTLDLLKIIIRRLGSPGNVIFTIKDVSGGEPGSTTLDTVTVNGNNFSTSYNEEEITLNGITFEKDVNYCMVVSAPDAPDFNNVFRIDGINVGNVYPAGTYWSSVDSGTNWTEYPNVDINFNLLTIISAGGAGTSEIATNYPITSGLELADKHEGRQINLVPEESSKVPDRLQVGL